MDDFAKISIESFSSEVRRRIANVEKSLDCLKNQDGGYANQHRELLGMYYAVKAVVDAAKTKKAA